MYVQHKIKEQAKLVWKWINEYGASVFIAGYINFCNNIILTVISCSNAKQMPIDVMDSIKYACTFAGGLNDMQTDQYIHAMETKRRLQLETWA